MVHDVADFLRAHAPFDALAGEDLDRVAAAVEIEFHPAGAVVLGQGQEPLAHVWVVRTGTVELLDRARVLDLLGEGEMIGHGSMLSGLPAGFEVRAAEDALLYRLPAQVITPLLTGAAGVRFVARTLRARSLALGPGAEHTPPADARQRPVASLVRRTPVICPPDATIREAARRITQAGVTAVVVDCGEGRLGIVTDRDLRSRVATGEVGVDEPLERVMTPDAFTIEPERLGGEALVEMLDRGVRHAPVVDARGTVLGVLDDLDVFAGESRGPFRVRRAIAEAPDARALHAASRELWPAALALFDAGLDPGRVSATASVMTDALMRRAVELAIDELGPPPVPVSWLALGSLGRREVMPSSDADTGLVWHGEDADPELRRATGALAARVMAVLERCGLAADEHGVRADRPLFARSEDAWEAAFLEWAGDPEQPKVLIAVSVMLDGRVVWGAQGDAPLLPALARAAQRPALVRLLARSALSHRPPTGFRRALVVEHSGEHRGRLDVKRGGMLPIADLARWAGLAAGSPATATVERLRAGAGAGVLSAEQARTLEEAWDLVLSLRLEHQLALVRAGRPPHDHLDPQELNPLTRRYLREAFRSVAAVQRDVANVLSPGSRW